MSAVPPTPMQIFTEGWWWRPDEAAAAEDLERADELRRLAGQPRRHSAAESVANIAVGYGVAIGTQLILFPLFGIDVPLSTNLSIGLIFAAISVARSYCIRRLFNLWHVWRLS